MSTPFTQGFGDRIHRGMGVNYEVQADGQDEGRRQSNQTAGDYVTAIHEAPLASALQTNEGINDGTVAIVSKLRAFGDTGHQVGQLHLDAADAATSTLRISPTA